MKEGDIVLFRKIKGNFISQAIAHITGSSYVHCGIVYKVTNDTIVIAEALSNGFVKSVYDKKEFYDKITNREVYIMKTKKPLNHVQLHVNKMLGKPYGYLDLLVILVYTITGKRLLKGTSNSLICSEAVSRVLLSASNNIVNLPKEYDKEHSYITPDDIFFSIQLTR